MNLSLNRMILMPMLGGMSMMTKTITIVILITIDIALIVMIDMILSVTCDQPDGL